MILLWHIFSRAIPAGAILIASVAFRTEAATVTGRIELQDSRDPTVRKKNDLSGVVVSLEPVNGTAPRNPPRTARIGQKNKTFSPHILAVAEGTTVEFPNFDPIYHNAFSSYSGQ